MRYFAEIILAFRKIYYCIEILDITSNFHHSHWWKLKTRVKKIRQVSPFQHFSFIASAKTFCQSGWVLLKVSHGDYSYISVTQPSLSFSRCLCVSMSQTLYLFQPRASLSSSLSLCLCVSKIFMPGWLVALSWLILSLFSVQEWWLSFIFYLRLIFCLIKVLKLSTHSLQSSFVFSCCDK